MLTGPDVSRYQPTWSPQPDDEFVFIKATEGRTVTSPTMEGQADAARAKGLVVGFYHFLWPDNAVDQAAYFVRQALMEPGDLLVCDWEQAGREKVIASEADKNAFLAEVKRLAPEHRIGLYTYTSLWNRSARRAGDFLWIAHYGVNKPNVTEPWTFWQWTNEPIDQNYGQFATQATLRAWAGALQEDKMPMTPEEREQLIADIADAVAARLDIPTPKEIAEVVFRLDGEIENVGIHPRGGSHVTLATAIEYLAERART